MILRFRIESMEVQPLISPDRFGINTPNSIRNMNHNKKEQYQYIILELSFSFCFNDIDVCRAQMCIRACDCMRTSVNEDSWILFFLFYVLELFTSLTH